MLISEIAIESANEGEAGHASTSIISDPSFWVFVGTCLVIAIFIVKKVPSAIASILDNKKQEITKELEKAKALREEAQTLLANYKRELENVEEHSNEIIKNAKQSAKIIKENSQKEVQEMIERKEKAASDRLEYEKAEFKQQLKRLLANEVIEQVSAELQSKIDNKSYDKILDEAILKLEQSEISNNYKN